MSRRRVDPFAVPSGEGQGGRRRIDRSGAVVAAIIDREKAAPLRPVRRIAAIADMILCVPDAEGAALSPQDRNAFRAAAALRDPQGVLTALVFGAVPTGLAEEGVDRVMALPAQVDPDHRAALLLAVMREWDARHILFADTAAGADLGRRLAARMGGMPGDDPAQLQPVMIAGARFDAARAAEAGEALSLVSPDTVGEAAQPVVYGEPLRPSPNAVALAEAEAVLSGGNGISDWPGLLALAERLAMPIGASRVAVDAGHVPRPRQVGASGTILTARHYLAFGISGAPQHLEGIRDCESVAAVNTDPAAAIMQRAGLALVADGDAVIAALHRALDRRNA